jgi:hypothetical protein
MKASCFTRFKYLTYYDPFCDEFTASFCAYTKDLNLHQLLGNYFGLNKRIILDHNWGFSHEGKRVLNICYKFDGPTEIEANLIFPDLLKTLEVTY